MSSRLLLSLLLVALTAAPAAGKGGTDGEQLAAQREKMVNDLAALRFERLGNPVLRWDHIPAVEAPADRPHKLLVVLVEYPDVHFDRYKGEAGQASKLVKYYEGELFDAKYEKPGTLSHYYLTQSLGRYHLQGQVLPPLTLSKPRAAYGLPHRPEGGSWRNDTDGEGMVEEVLLALDKAYPDLDWASFDRWDPHDYDGDGVLDEADGYLDHFVIVYAGGGQSSCQRLYKLDEVLNPNVGPEALDTLSPEARECVERMWPHRFMVQKRTGEGPAIEGLLNARGGVPVRPALWARDYNMQSEYTDVSTFIHEFGHSIGLPDVYARTSTNSTGGWEVMSATASPLPQSMSAWSRMMLGWLRPLVVVPPEFGGKAVQSGYLRVLDDGGTADSETTDLGVGLGRAVMVVLPPKVRTVDLGGLPRSSGTRALYSGQGNELDRVTEIRLDLRGEQGPVTLDFDAWWQIEGGWDFAYLETSIDGGRTWQRHVTDDRKLMPAKHGHDGAATLPGFTGLSGDLDGDGKNEQAKGCNPKRKMEHGEDLAGAAKDPCLNATWVHPSFTLPDLAGHEARIRLRYFTDMAAVEPGILIDNVRVALGSDKGARTLLSETFEGQPDPAFRLGDYSLSEGRHTLLVPHYYLLEYRDPYAPDEGTHRYDAALADPVDAFFADPKDGTMRELAVRSRPGVMAWYYDGAFAWSENDPATNGQGKGYLLALDAWPNEIALPGYEAWYKGDPTHFDTHYEVDGPDAQTALAAAYQKTLCFVRNDAYRPRDLPEAMATCPTKDAPVGGLTSDGKPLMYSYELYNRLLPGAERDTYEPASELLDTKLRDGKLTLRMRDVSLRYLHSTDAPFSLEPFPGHVRVREVRDGALVEVASREAPAVSRFESTPASRWANPKLYFGGVAVPPIPFAFELAKVGPQAPDKARVKVYLFWNP